MQNKRYDGYYKGIVIQSDDPEQIGRVKVFVPQVSMALLEGWTKDRTKNRMFTGLGQNLESSLTPELLQRLKEALPWAQIKHPIFGMGTSITYHADIDYAEKSNDSDSSVQQKTVNKNTPETPQTSVSSALASTSKPEPTKSDTTPSMPAYVANSSTAADPVQPPAPIPTTISTASQSDNIAGVTIEYNNPVFNARNRRQRLFNSSFTIDDLTGRIDSSGTRQVNTYSGPATIRYALPSGQSTTTPNIPIKVLPVGSDKPQVIQSNILVYKNGQLISSDNKTVIDTSDITNIIITPGISGPIDLESKRLSGISPLIKEYTATPTTISSAPILPPSIISPNSHNAGGGGSALNALTFSDILPFDALTKSIIGGSNPNSIINQTKKTEPDKQTDPKKTKEPNTQVPPKTQPELRSSTQSEKVKGMISIPAVGSHVSIYFENGDYMFPIVDGVFYSQEDVKGIYDVQE
jgi:hypothetical protein